MEKKKKKKRTTILTSQMIENREMTMNDLVTCSQQNCTIVYSFFLI